jgi:hypothetical protein
MGRVCDQPVACHTADRTKPLPPGAAAEHDLIPLSFAPPGVADNGRTVRPEASQTSAV